jgi:hypothetical protein
MLLRPRYGVVFALALACLTTSWPSMAQVAVFDNTTKPTGATAFTIFEIGNQVQIASPSVLTKLEIGVYSQRFAATVDSLQAFLYANDGAGGTPGTQLWASSILTNVSLTGGYDLIPFALPDIAVPNTFTWTLQTGAATPVAAGLPAFDAPATGTVLHAWFGVPGTWISLDANGIHSHYMARISTTSITAVPESGTLLPLAGILLSGATILYRRKNA